MTEQAKQEFIALRRTVIAAVFQSLNEKQREAVLATEGPLLLLAGAGSGKTTVLINRIANLMLFGSASDTERVPEGAGSGEPGWARLVLGGAARSWLIFAIVWGSILYVGQASVQAALGNNTSTRDQYNTIVTDFNATGTAVRRAGADAQRCSTVQCVRPSHLAAAASFSTFSNDLEGMSLPANASNSANLVKGDADKLATIFTDLADSSSASAYQATAQRNNISGVIASYAANTRSLLNDVRANL